MLYTAALARIWAHMIIDLACRPVLPLDFETYAEELRDYFSDWAAKYDPGKKKAAGLFAQLAKMEEAAMEARPLLLDLAKTPNIDKGVLKRVNELIIGLEREFTDPRGIPRRPWYKHLVFGARYTYDVLLLPALTEASEAGDEKDVMTAIGNLEKSAAAATARLGQIAAFLKKEI
jgi:N-acetylated-alpha-linked acidic dipeptidase